MAGPPLLLCTLCRQSVGASTKQTTAVISIRLLVQLGFLRRVNHQTLPNYKRPMRDLTIHDSHHDPVNILHKSRGSSLASSRSRRCDVPSSHPSFIHSFIQSIIQSLIHSFNHSFNSSSSSSSSSSSPSLMPRGVLVDDKGSSLLFGARFAGVLVVVPLSTTLTVVSAQGQHTHTHTHSRS